MKEKIISWIKIIFAILICTTFIGIFAITFYNTISMDSDLKGNNYQEGEFLTDTKNIFWTAGNNEDILRVLRDIFDERTSNLSSDISKILSNNNRDSETKEYFTQLKRDIKKLFNYTDGAKIENINTNYYIRKSYLIERLFDTRPKEFRSLYSCIIPYYFIKHYNYANISKNFQREQLSTYSAFLHTFVDGKTSLNNRCANVFCLYVYAYYCQDTSMRPDAYLRLKSQIDRFINNFKNQLSVGGNMDLYKDYLNRANKVLNQYIKDRGQIFGSLKTALKNAFNIDTLEPFSKSNL